jgi:hypothetical protein
MDRVHQPWTRRGTGPWWIQGGCGQETHRSASSPALWGLKVRRGRCKRESSLRGSLPAARTGGGGGPMRREALGHRRRWDFNGVVGFME